MQADDVAMDRSYDAYLRARTQGAKAEALAALLRVSEPFIGRVVRHLSRGPIRDLEPEDALQTARIGFVDAVHRADPAKGPLRPFAMSRIRHELQTLTEASYTIKIPRRSGLPAHVMKKIETIYTRDGREPTREELNGHAQLYDDAANRPRVVTSFDAPHSESGDGLAIRDLIGSDSPGALELLLEREQRILSLQPLATIEKAIAAPPARTPKPRKIPIMPTAPDSSALTLDVANPLDVLKNAIASVQSHLRSLDEREAAIQRERGEYRAQLSKLTAPFGLASPASNVAPIRPVVPLNQDKIHHRIVAFLKANPRSKLPVLAKAIGETPKAVSDAIQKLRDAKQVTSSGKARGTVYSVPTARAA